MHKFYLISGYYKDDKSDEFNDYLVTDSQEELEDIDDSIFYYGLTEEYIKEYLNKEENGILDFVITSYEETTL